MAVIDDNSEYGKGIADIVASSLPTSGATVPVRDHIDPKATDYSATVNGVNAGNVNAVFYGGYYQNAGPLLKQLRDAGNKATFVSDDGTKDDGFVAVRGAVFELARLDQHLASEDPARRDDESGDDTRRIVAHERLDRPGVLAVAGPYGRAHLEWHAPDRSTKRAASVA